MQPTEKEQITLEVEAQQKTDTAKKALRLIPETDQEEAELFRKTYGKDLSMMELALFWTHARRVKLDPLRKQIIAVKRNTKRGPVVTHQTTIDGLRAVAFRAGDHAGTDEIEFIYNEEAGDKKYPHKAICTTYKLMGGLRVKFVGTAKWSEFFPGEASKESFQWKKMPEVMIGKCAEAQALRKGWPEDLDKLYVNEEMHQAEFDVTPGGGSSDKANQINQLFGGKKDG